MGADAKPKEIDDDELLSALRSVASRLGNELLTSSAYDAFRAEHDPALPSTSMIRKRFGSWRPAVRAAGLRALGEPAEGDREITKALSSLRTAKGDLRAPLTPASYSEWYARLDDDERTRAVSFAQIVYFFGDWRRALNAAAIQADDILHPTSLWTSAEARAIRRHIEAITGEPLSAASYTSMQEDRGLKPLPSWDVLCELLAL
jgi:hypothetical protein